MNLATAIQCITFSSRLAARTFHKIDTELMLAYKTILYHPDCKFAPHKLMCSRRRQRSPSQSSFVSGARAKHCIPTNNNRAYLRTGASTIAAHSRPGYDQVFCGAKSILDSVQLRHPIGNADLSASNSRFKRAVFSLMSRSPAAEEYSTPARSPE